MMECGGIAAGGDMLAGLPVGLGILGEAAETGKADQAGEENQFAGLLAAACAALAGALPAGADQAELPPVTEGTTSTVLAEQASAMPLPVAQPVAEAADGVTTTIPQDVAAQGGEKAACGLPEGAQVAGSVTTPAGHGGATPATSAPAEDGETVAWTVVPRMAPSLAESGVDRPRSDPAAVTGVQPLDSGIGKTETVSESPGPGLDEGQNVVSSPMHPGKEDEARTAEPAGTRPAGEVWHPGEVDSGENRQPAPEAPGISPGKARQPGVVQSRGGESGTGQLTVEQPTTRPPREEWPLAADKPTAASEATGGAVDRRNHEALETKPALPAAVREESGRPDSSGEFKWQDGAPEKEGQVVVVRVRNEQIAPAREAPLASDEPVHPYSRVEFRDLPQFVRRAELVAQAKGPTEMRVQLVPEHLGRVSIRVTVAEGGVTAKLLVETPEVKTLVEQRMPELEQALREQGLRLDGLSVGCEDPGAGNGGFFRQEIPGHFRRELSNGAARREYEEAPVGLPEARPVMNRLWTGNGGLLDALV